MSEISFTIRRRIRHKKRGTTYAVIGAALVQCAKPLTDGAAVEVYADPCGGLWVRAAAEMTDGRFEDV